MSIEDEIGSMNGTLERIEDILERIAIVLEKKKVKKNDSR